MNVVDQLKLEYDDTVSPIIDDVREALLDVPKKSLLNKRMDATLHRYVNFTGQSLNLILNNLTNIRNSFDIIEKDIKGVFSVQFTNTNLTFARANVLLYIEALAFYIRYARKYLYFLVAQESAALGKATTVKWSPAETEWIDTNMDEFAALYQTMSLVPSEFKSKLQNAASAIIEESTYPVAMQSLGIQKTDPLHMDGFSPRNNPLTQLGKFISEMQIVRYNEAKEEFYGLQLRLQELRDLKTQQPTNPVIQKQIQAYEKRISEYEYDLRKIEEKAGL